MIGSAGERAVPLALVLTASERLLVLRLLVTLLVIGIIAGYMARLLVMGPDPIGFARTVLLGVTGSLIGGIAGSLIFAGKLVFGFAGPLLAIPGAMVALLVYRKVKLGSIMPPRDVLRSQRRPPRA
jgi:uncharacterized membrane protein YeaQ/YmgE (transglycosylase-associated protein family)